MATLTTIEPQDVPGLSEVVKRQKQLGNRIFWLLLIPLSISIILIPMFYTLNSRLVQIETAEKLVTIERILSEDQNQAWAVGEYEKLADTYPSADILARLGILYFLQSPENKEKAVKTLLKAREVDPKSWQVYRYLTYIFTVTNEPSKAIEYGYLALEFNTSDANAMNNLAWVHAHATSDPKILNLDAALKHATKAVALTKPKRWDYLDTLAEVYHLRGEEDRAKISLRAAYKVANNGSQIDLREKFSQWFPNERLPLN